VRRQVGLILWLLIAVTGRTSAQTPTTPDEMYKAWCSKCHAQDGTGNVAERTVKTVPMDFTDCHLASAEPEADWQQVIAHGGPAVGRSPEMPAFGEFLSDAQLIGLVHYVRAFCAEPGWPHGNMNLPRPLFTEKAFPEDELVIAPAISHKTNADTDFGLRAVYEHRFGRRGHAEVGVPFSSVSADGRRRQGVGDLSVAGKYVLVADKPGTHIVSAGFEVSFPTGNDTRGLGEGTTLYEPFVAAGAILGSTYLQASFNLEMPARAPWGDREAGYNVYLGRDTSLSPDTWTLAFEINGANRELAVTPQIRKGLTKTGALGAAVGVRLPITEREEQSTRWAGYLIWDYLEPVRARR
jgi:mono/diheme cytochrome c family protein